MPDPILKRIGLALIVFSVLNVILGLFSIGAISIFNVWPVIAGVFLIRGNIIVASYIRLLAMATIVLTPTLLIFLPLRHPTGLWITQCRLHPSSILFPGIEATIGIAFCLWAAQQFNRGPLKAAMAREGRNPPGIGLLAMVCVSAFLINCVISGYDIWFQNRFGGQAAMLAEQQLGPGFRYQVSLQKLTMDSRHKSVSALVTAWNQQEIRQVSVHWDEP